MPISFLNPWLWFGALAIAAPLWLHLRRRQQTDLFRFSAVRFLSDQPAPSRSPLQLRRRWLFALRLLGLLLLIAAFAWPYFRGGHNPAVRESRVYILDNTMSHQAGDGFNRDRRRLLAELGANGVETAVIELTSSPRLLVGFGEPLPGARQKVAALRPSYQRGSYLAAFRQANALLADARGRQKRIVLLGDGQENQWNEEISTPPFLRDVQLDVPAPKNRSLPNLSLSEPRVQRVIAGDRALVNFSVKLQHLGPARQAQLLVRVNSQEIIKRKVDLQGQPETLVLQGKWEADPAGWLAGEAVVEGEPDALPADNRVFFSLAPLAEGTVAVLAQSPHLRLALSPEVMHGRWAARLVDPGQVQSEANKRRADVLCIESSYLQSSEARHLVRDYLAAGRGVFLMVNHLSPAIEGCLRELGFEPEGAARSGAETFEFLLSNHPIFHPLLSPDYGNLQDVKVSEFIRLKSVGSTPLVVGRSGETLFFQSARFKGKLFVAAFGLDREHTSWPIHPSFIPFLDLTLQAARTADAVPPTFEPGQIARLQIHSRGGSPTFMLRSGGQELARATAEGNAVRIRLPDAPGAYTLSREGQDGLDQIVCVNPPAKESQLVYIDAPAALKTWRLQPGHRSGVDLSPATVQPWLNALLQQRLWWWMLLAGLLALIAEMALADVRKEGR